MTEISAYRKFLKTKLCLAENHGFTVDDSEISPILKPHQRDIVKWAVRRGRAAIFAAFGLGKTIMQLEIIRLMLGVIGGRGLIVLPLGVRQEFRRDAGLLDIETRFIRETREATDPGIYLTNYESMREKKLDPAAFDIVSFDEAAFLRSFGSKTFGEMVFGSVQRVKYRFVATATPSPNDFLELLGYSACLGVMDIGEAKTRFFRRNSEKSDDLTLHPHKEREFWLWIASWAIFLQKPSDLGHSDDGYELPDIDVRWHELPSDHNGAGHEWDGQGRLIKSSAIGVTQAAREKRDSLPLRIAKLLELRDEDPDAHRLIWHDLEAERHAIEKAIPDAVNHVAIGDRLRDRKSLPIDFMLIPPQSWHPEVWTDVTRMRTLNGTQSRRGRQMHICPLQFDICDRAIAQYTMEGETVFDPFAGLGTVPLRAVKLGRVGWGVELSPGYFDDAVGYLRAAEQERSFGTLFDLVRGAGHETSSTERGDQS